MTFFHVQDLPQIPQDCRSNTHEGEQSNHLAPQRAGKSCSGSKKPEPPSPRKLAVSLLVEFDVTEDRKSHEEHERSVKQDESRLGDVTVIWASDQAVNLYCDAYRTELGKPRTPQCLWGIQILAW